MKMFPSKKSFVQRWKEGKTQGSLTGFVASLIDEMYTLETGSRLGDFLRGIKARALYTLFIPATLIDTIRYYSLYRVLKTRAWFKDESTEGLLKLKDHGRKHGLGFLVSLLGFINPRAMSVLFVSKHYYTNKIQSGGKVDYQKAILKQPKSIEEVAQQIKEAVIARKSVSIKGAGFSQGQQYLPAEQNGIVLDLSKMGHIQIEGDVATITGGVTWSQLQRSANELGLAVDVMQASNVFQILSSISTNVHGWAHRSGSVGQTVEELTVVTGNGDLNTVKPGDAWFHHVVGGLGQHGVIVQAKIKLVENRVLTPRGEEVAIENYAKYFEEKILSDESVNMHLYRLSIDPKKPLLEGVALSYVDHQGAVSKDPIEHEGEQGTRLERILINIARTFDFSRGWYWNSEKKALIKNTKPQSRNDIMHPAINAMFNPAQSEAEWLQEFFVPGNQLNRFLNNLSPLLADYQVKLLNASVRFVKKDTVSRMAYAPEDRFAVVLCFNQRLSHDYVSDAKVWIKKATQMALDCGGSYYLPYQPVVSQQQFQQSYPKAQAFKAFKEQSDPHGLFNTGFSSQYLQESKPTMYHQLMSSPDLQEEFSGFLTRVLKKVKPYEFYKLLEDVLRTEHTSDDIYATLLRRMPEIKPGFVEGLKRDYSALIDIQQELSQQALKLMNEQGNYAKPIDGILEIGYPARFIQPLRTTLGMTGPSYVVNFDEESVADLLQCGYPRPYQAFDVIHSEKAAFKPLSPDKFPTHSVDMVTCFIGLHHVPEQELSAFLASIRRVLRPGGTFLLVDHDVKNDHDHLMANLAHSIFNAANGIALQEEIKEVRHFKSAQAWQAILKEHGFEVSSKSLEIREGDPSLNAMMRFSVTPLQPDLGWHQHRNFTPYQQTQVQRLNAEPRQLIQPRRANSSAQKPH